MTFAAKENFPLFVIDSGFSLVKNSIDNIIGIDCSTRNVIEVDSKETLGIFVGLIQSNYLRLVPDSSLTVFHVDFKAHVIIISSVRVTIHK